MITTSRAIPIEEVNKITEKIIGSAYKVSNTLGVGFLEKVYENALAHEIRKTGLHVEQQASVKVVYDGAIVGEYLADLLVENCVIIELKVVDRILDIHRAQCLNYLKGSGLHVCLLINFGRTRIERERIVHNLQE
jgi:GxxExxY protein